MARIFGKLLDYIGFEEETDQEDYYGDDQGYDYNNEGNEESRETYTKKGRVVNIHQNNNVKMIIFQPRSYEDAQNIIDSLKNRKPVITNLESLELDMAQRVIDIMSGAMYALEGNIHKVASGIYVFAPKNVDVSGNVMDEDFSGQSFFEYMGG